MRFSLDTFMIAILLLAQSTNVLAHPQPISETQLLTREQAEALDKRNEISDLWKRKGGGGGGGKGGGSSGGSSSGKGGSSSSGSSSSGYVSSSSSPKGDSSRSRSSKGSGSGEKGGVGSSTSSQQQGSSSGAAGTKNSPSVGAGKVDARSASPTSSFWKRPVFSFGGFRGFSSGGRSGSSRGSSSSKPKSNSHSSSTGKGSSSSNAGGSTKTGSGVTPNYGGGRYYGGGATTPYTSGLRSPLGIAPVFLGVGLLSFYPGLWLYGAYNYPYTHPYTFHNHTATANSTNTTTTRRDLGFEVLIRQSTDEGVNETKPVTCLCAVYLECGCDDNGNTTFLDSIIGDGTYANLNQSLVTVADVNGTSTIVLNGTLPNGTTASGGTEDAFSGAVRNTIEMSGYWVMIALVGMTVYLV